MAKYGNTIVNLDGRSFHSKLEASTYGILKLRMKAGEITGIECQVSVYLTRARIQYIPDFRVTMKDGSFRYVEAKGYVAPTWPMKKKLWKHYADAPLEIWGGHYSRPSLMETITPISHPVDE